MGIYEDIGLDPNVNRNSFTVDDAAAIFKKAAKAVKSKDAEMVKKLLDAGFDLLKIIAMFAK
jgi:hypothetical protein